MKTYTDLNTTLALTHADDLLREAERIRLLNEAHRANPELQNRMLKGIGEVLISGGQWLKDRSHPHSSN